MNTQSTSVTAIAIYQAKPGQEEKLWKLLPAHSEILLAEGLRTQTSYPPLKTSDGFVLEFIEWTSEEAAGQAHENLQVQKIWSALAELADFRTLGELPQEVLSRPFPKFEPLPRL